MNPKILVSLVLSCYLSQAYAGSTRKYTCELTSKIEPALPSNDWTRLFIAPPRLRVRVSREGVVSMWGPAPDGRYVDCKAAEALSPAATPNVPGSARVEGSRCGPFGEGQVTLSDLNDNPTMTIQLTFEAQTYSCRLR